MSRFFAIIDGNSIGHMSQGMKPITIGNLQVHAIFHFLRTMRSLLSKYPNATPIVLWDGASWRKTVYRDYKANRNKATTPSEIKKQEEVKSYHKQRPYIEKALMYLGVTQVKAANMEADDLAAIMVNRYLARGDKVVLVTEDRDWLQLIQPGVTVERPRTGDRVTERNFTEVTGCTTTKEFVQVKGLMGDAGDHIKGVGNIGEARALEFVREYGTMDQFLEKVMLKEIDYKKLPKYLRDLVDVEDKALKFAFNLTLMDLNTPNRPPVQDLMIEKGENNLEKFRLFCETLLFQDITRDLGLWAEVFPVARAA